MRALVRAVAMSAALLVLHAPSASAAAALLAVDDASPSLTDGDTSRTTTLALTNLTDGALQLSVAPEPADADCRPTLSRAAIGAAQSVDVKVTVPAKCELEADEFDFALTARGDESQTIPIAAAASDDVPDPDWSHLAVFFLALPLVGFVMYGVTRSHGYALALPLTYLEKTYSFKESWVSNVTVVGGLLTGLFGSAEVVKALLGEDAERSLALATVGSAIALIFIGTGPIVLTAAKTSIVEKGRHVDVFTVRGLLLATTVTFAGALGQLYIGWQTGVALDLDGWEDGLVLGFALAVALLIWYTVTTLRSTLRAGTERPTAAPPSKLDELVELFTEALERNDDVPNEAVPAVVGDVLDAYPGGGTSLGDEPYVPPRRQTAMM